MGQTSTHCVSSRKNDKEAGAKKTGVKRREMLLEIQPDLPKTHSPEIRVVESNPGDVNGRHSQRDVFLLPYANLEDLSWNNGIQFLSLLHYRARNFPSAFAHFDCDTLHFGIVAGGIRRIHAPDCSMLCFGGRETYGNVVKWGEPIGKGKDAPDGFELEWEWGEAMPLSDGLLVLETQTKLITLLLRVVSNILYDQDLNDLTTPSAPAPVLPPPEIPLAGSSFEFLSLARTNSLHAYTEPPGYSFAQLDDIAQTRYDLAVNHFIDLRTDPTYLSEQLNQYYIHRIERLANGAVPDVLVENMAVTFLLLDTYNDIAKWHVFRKILAEISEIHAQFPSLPERGARLPHAYENALQELRPLIINLQQGCNVRFPTTMAGSPPLRQYFTVNFFDNTFSRNQLSYNPRIQKIRSPPSFACCWTRMKNIFGKSLAFMTNWTCSWTIVNSTSVYLRYLERCYPTWGHIITSLKFWILTGQKFEMKVLMI
ncbi:hypothetical protein BD410DRAFT_188801 [Rickenella mellea]|uniref:Uncharacterized protein n=1 Tax=Rickenella mellea TaxID=50990 RepID=A0A4Y7Q790_9AGAM|nr:hypothetical protein BD410DRAFT_188801 [Rickenella mellea]